MARTDINRYRGDTKDLVLKLTQDKQVFDLTGFSAVMGVNSEENPTEDNCVFQSTAAVDVTLGTLTFPFAAGDVDRIGEFYYDVQLTDGAGKISTIRKGKFIFAQDITKQTSLFIPNVGGRAFKGETSLAECTLLRMLKLKNFKICILLLFYVLY